MQDFDFETWWDIFLERVRKGGHSGPVDKYTFEWNWEWGETPEQAADEFVKEMQ